MGKIKVCHLTSAHNPYDVRIFHKECLSLQKAGYDVTIIAPCSDGQTMDDQTKEGIRIKKIKKYTSRFRRFTKTVWEVYYKAVEQQATIYHFHDPDLLLIGLALKIRGAKVIYDVHEDVPRQIMSKYWIPRPFRKACSIIVELVENIASTFFVAIIAATPYIRQRFAKLNGNTVNINNYPNLDELYTPRQHSGKSKELVVCYAGALSLERGLKEMINAIQSTNAKLFIAGPVNCPELTYDTGKVLFLGVLERSELKKLFAQAIAGIVIFHPEPNHINAQPNKLFEYMSAGLPVIASAFPLWQEIVRKAECGICVDPLDTEEISVAINWIIDHPAKAEQMGARGREAVEELYNWDREKDKLCQAYNKLHE